MAPISSVVYHVILCRKITRNTHCVGNERIYLLCLGVYSYIAVIKEPSYTHDKLLEVWGHTTFKVGFNYMQQDRTCQQKGHNLIVFSSCLLPNTLISSYQLMA